MTARAERGRAGDLTPEQTTLLVELRAAMRRLEPIWQLVADMDDEALLAAVEAGLAERPCTPGEWFAFAEPDIRAAAGALAKLRPATDSRRRRRGRYARTQALADVILDVVNVAFATMSLSTRQVYYQCVSRGAVENCQRSYDRVQRLLVELRRDGEIAYERIVDRTREKHQRAAWEGVQKIMQAVETQYRRDLWAEQSTIVMVACEKEALEGIFAEAVDAFGASLWTLRGFISEGFAYEWAETVRRHADQGKSTIVYYFGDHDPSGLEIERCAREKLADFGAEVEWHRAGLLAEDFERFEIVELPVKRTDSRARRYLAEHGDRGAELDALPPDELRRRIREVIASHIDVEPWERLEAVEAAERESLHMVVENWERAVAAARSA